MTEETQSSAKVYTAERIMSVNRASKKPEIVNGLMRMMMSELAGPIFASANMHEVALVFQTRADVIDRTLRLQLTAIVRDVTEAMDFPYSFDKGEPLTANVEVKKEKPEAQDA